MTPALFVLAWFLTGAVLAPFVGRALRRLDR